MNKHWAAKLEIWQISSGGVWPQNPNFAGTAEILASPESQMPHRAPNKQVPKKTLNGILHKDGILILILNLILVKMLLMVFILVQHFRIWKCNFLRKMFSGIINISHSWRWKVSNYELVLNISVARTRLCNRESNVSTEAKWQKD